MRNKIDISKEDLVELYYNQKQSKYKIGSIYNCSFKTVLNRMREYNMRPLHRSAIQSKYDKKNFDGDNVIKAYLIGLRLGDLNVYKTSDHSEVVVVRCHSTHKVQINLIKDLFSAYGKVTISQNKKTLSYQVNCFLNNSFVFLLPKNGCVPTWINKNKKTSFSFAAGYVDAEGNIRVYDGRARFKIDSYDKEIIFWLYNLFKKNKINCPAPKKIGAKDQVYNKTRGYKYNQDVYRIRISQADSLNKLLSLLKPYIKHKNRLRDINNCLANLYARKN